MAQLMRSCITEFIAAPLLVLLILASTSPSFQVHVKGDDGRQHGSPALRQRLAAATCFETTAGFCWVKQCQSFCASKGFNAASAFCYKRPGSGRLHLWQCCCQP
ncbi:uncharacterized protein LOC100274719 precursor [Zea mays]|uniref:Knottin scorpion toxin-like domain-containing protein n=1 Tax=Zea mays TaxID=4577 RepID=B6SHM3_MAIZE|nr:uncharacterized protein LOC100274719 precursor [Zea mays]ACG24356.1 hypothetical protein [Zea mays]AQK58745.1 hypothetical protein ZEAMMB73_Zm00001d053095 [Zea mays]|eukprot:NP_001142491.1 uncharacterized protein LOC100274719 precursor [Zea mays]